MSLLSVLEKVAYMAGSFVGGVKGIIMDLTPLDPPKEPTDEDLLAFDRLQQLEPDQFEKLSDLPNDIFEQALKNMSDDEFDEFVRTQLS